MNEVKKHRSIWPAILFGIAGCISLLPSLFANDQGDRISQYMPASESHMEYHISMGESKTARVSIAEDPTPSIGIPIILLLFTLIYWMFHLRLDSLLGIGHFLCWLPLSAPGFMWLGRGLTGGTERTYHGFSSVYPHLSILTVLPVILAIGFLFFVFNVIISVVRVTRSTNIPRK